MKLPYRILVLDDDENALSGIVELLRDAEYGVTGAVTYDAAKRHLESRSFDLLITDVRLRGFNGLNLVMKCRSDYPDMAVIIISGYEEPLMDLEASRYQAIFISKPIRPAAFLETVAHCLASVRRERRWPRKRVIGGFRVTAAGKPAAVVTCRMAACAGIVERDQPGAVVFRWNWRESACHSTCIRCACPTEKAPGCCAARHNAAITAPPPTPGGDRRSAVRRSVQRSHGYRISISTTPLLTSARARAGCRRGRTITRGAPGQAERPELGLGTSPPANAVDRAVLPRGFARRDRRALRDAQRRLAAARAGAKYLGLASPRRSPCFSSRICSSIASWTHMACGSAALVPAAGVVG